MDSKKRLEEMIHSVKLNENTVDALKKDIRGTFIEDDFTEEEIETAFEQTEDLVPSEFIGVGATYWAGYAGLGGDAYPYKVIWCDGDIMILRGLDFTIEDWTVGEGTIGEMNDSMLVCKFKKNKGWFVKGTKTQVYVGHARAYRNPSF